MTGEELKTQMRKRKVTVQALAAELRVKPSVVTKARKEGPDAICNCRCTPDLVWAALQKLGRRPAPAGLKQPVIVSYGGGVNSTALLVGMVERGERPDAILFADTGGEKPETYEYVAAFSAWLVERGFPPVTVVQNDGKYRTLENNALQTQSLPSIAYGRRACSEKYKQRPQHKWVRRWQPALDWWATTDDRGDRNLVMKLIGYGADEGHRGNVGDVQLTADAWYKYRYPLQEWGWDREDCLAAIARAGLPKPIKSACFFCPSSTKAEVKWLAARHPDLFDRAVAMERAAADTLRTVKGLGRRFSWAGLIRMEREQPSLFGDAPPEGANELAVIPCMCHVATPVDDGDDNACGECPAPGAKASA